MITSGRPTIEDLKVEFRNGMEHLFKTDRPDPEVRVLVRMFCMGAVCTLKVSGQVELGGYLAAQLVPMMASDNWDVKAWRPMTTTY